MQLIHLLVTVSLQVSLAALVLAAALDATIDDLLFLLRRPLLLLRAVLAVSVIVPIVAVIVVSVLPLSPISRMAIVLMAAAPVPPLVPGKGVKLGGRKCYVYGLYLAFALLTVLLVPVTVRALGAWFDSPVAISFAAVARLMLASVLAPLIVGVAIRTAAPALAERASPWVSRLAMLILICALAPILIRVWPAMMQRLGDGTGLGMLTVILSGFAAGYLLAGPERADRVALGGAAATRHPGIALVVANANNADPRVTAAILLFSLVGLAVMPVYQALIRRGGARETGTPAAV
jgi:BASS family bile acid:Na+ symporter